MSPNRTIRLPRVIWRSPTGLTYFVFWAPFIAIYQIVNRWPVFAPRVLPVTWFDAGIPFVPWFFPVYVGYIPLYWWTVARSENDTEANRIFYASYFQLLLSVPFFVLLPVSMPPGLIHHGDPYNWADAAWRWFDAPNNCFPSLHVSNALLLLQFNWRRRFRWLHALASVAVVVSTVLVKQHYVADVWGGVAVYVASRWFLTRLEIAAPRVVGRAEPRDALWSRSRAR
jgi:PAP2 superfamily protein